jgi:16S rRNA G966 N2-methylase RsmD
VSRPITDRVKESLFSVLYKYDLPDGKIAADLFCGVGSLGLEALSRGAEFVTFVEKDPKIIATLKKNIEKAGFAGPATARSAVTSESPLGDTLLRSGTPYGGWKAGHGTSRTRARVIRADAFKIGAPVRLRESAIASAEAIDEQKYDLVFVDPPYSTTKETKEGSPLSKLLVLLSEQLSPDGIVVVRTEKRTELLEQYGQLGVIERRQWGTMAVTILQRPATARP